MLEIINALETIPMIFTAGFFIKPKSISIKGTGNRNIIKTYLITNIVSPVLLIWLE